jgi:hypothetical protein
MRHAKGLTERGHTVQLIVQRGSPIAELAGQHRMRTHFVNMRRMTVSALQAFRNILLTEKPHLLHVNSSRDSWLGALAARCIRARIKVVKTRHISAPLNRNLPTRLLYRRLFDHVIVTGGPTNKRGLVERDGLKPSAFRLSLLVWTATSSARDRRQRISVSPWDSRPRIGSSGFYPISARTKAIATSLKQRLEYSHVARRSHFSLLERDRKKYPLRPISGRWASANTCSCSGTERIR